LRKIWKFHDDGISKLTAIIANGNFVS